MSEESWGSVQCIVKLLNIKIKYKRHKSKFLKKSGSQSCQTHTLGYLEVVTKRKRMIVEPILAFFTKDLHNNMIRVVEISTTDVATS